LPSDRTRIQLCGKVVVELAGHRVEHALPGPQGLLLFAYLATNRRRRVERDEISDALWPSATSRSNESALRSLTSKLRRTLTDEVLQGRGSLQLVLPSDAWVDLEAADSAIHRAESAVGRSQWLDAWAPSHIALNVSRRTLLPGLDRPFLDQLRRHLADIRVRALECWAAAGLGIGGPELADSEAAAQTLVAESPLRESAYVLLMHILEARGKPAHAVQAYEELRRSLGDELGIIPGPEARAVYTRLLQVESS
jgi:SARP family transcriptional regulator, regulator of embCAB operon